MDTRRIVLIWLVLLYGVGGTAAFAAPMCSGATLTTYLAPNFACTQDNGILTFKSFVFNGPQIGLNSDQINVGLVNVLGVVGFTFSGNFVVLAGQNATYVISYFIDSVQPIIHGDHIELDPIVPLPLLPDLFSTV